MKSSQKIQLSTGGVLVTLGIIFGDIGTSPLYVIKAIATGHIISKQLIYGGASCVFWTLTMITTLKYVIIALNADNKGEGGIFALYARLRKYRSPWIIFPAIIGCATLISDGFITPPISISSAVEGLTLINADIPTVPIVIIILVALFIFQQFGTNKIGTVFGPVMVVWFTMMALFGLIEISKHIEILKAVNPVYAYDLIRHYPQGIWLLGAVFLCTTGAEALYSDLGHCGKANIRVSWGFVKIALLTSYFGQSAYVMEFEGLIYDGASPFYALMPNWFLPVGILIATVATIIASQALISGTFTMINEAMKLRLWPKLKVIHPGKLKGQIYLPSVNWLLLAGCTTVVLIFRESANMESAYGLAIIIDMLMTTTLLSYLIFVRFKFYWPVVAFVSVFYLIEGTFFIANLSKFLHGGWFAFLIATVLFVLMLAFYQTIKIKEGMIAYVGMDKIRPILESVLVDESIDLTATNLVYLVMSGRKDHLDNNAVYSMFYGKPKRAKVYWFLHVGITDEPFGIDYSVEEHLPGQCFYVKINMGFKEPHLVHRIFNQIVLDLAAEGRIENKNIHPSLEKFEVPPDFQFIVTNTRLAVDTYLNPLEKFFMGIYRLLKRVSISTAEDFGLEVANVSYEIIPVVRTKGKKVELKKIIKRLP